MSGRRWQRRTKRGNTGSIFHQSTGKRDRIVVSRGRVYDVHMRSKDGHERADITSRVTLVRQNETPYAMKEQQVEEAGGPEGGGRGVGGERGEEREENGRGRENDGDAGRWGSERSSRAVVIRVDFTRRSRRAWPTKSAANVTNGQGARPVGNTAASPVHKLARETTISKRRGRKSRAFHRVRSVALLRGIAE